ncbi:MAG: hypothetical protein ABJC33_10990, partial [Betaproteobacteria bacterium]
ERHASAELTGANTLRLLAAARADFSGLTLEPGRHEALGIFLRLLARGEITAHRAARAQAAYAFERRDRRFLHAQARQEAFPAVLFDAIASWLGAPVIALATDPYAEFETRVIAAAQAGRHVESVVATQGVLETLGAVLLGRLDAGLARRGCGFLRLRRALLRQESAHHAFGAERIARWRGDGTMDANRYSEMAAPYLALADEMIAAGGAALSHFGLTPTSLQRELRDHLGTIG